MSELERVHTDKAPAAIGPYSQAIVTDGWVFCSGQIALDPATGDLVGGDVARQTDQVLTNLRQVLEAAGAGMDTVVKTTVFLSDMGAFQAMNEVYARHFGDHRPARAAVQAAALPKGVDVEIEAIARVRAVAPGGTSSMFPHSKQVRPMSRIVRPLASAAAALALTLLAVADNAGAQQYDSALYGALHGRTWAAQRGGRSTAVAGSDARPNEYYFGASGGGLWKTTDGGQTWHPVTDGQLHSSSVGAVAVCPSNPDVVYIGMGETELRGNIEQGDGVYKSTDGGKTWKHIGLEATQSIAKIRIHPDNCDIAWVAALGVHSAPNPDRGVFKTTDGGATWRKVLFKSDKAGAIDLALDPRNPDVMYASIWEAWRKSWGMSSGGPDSGLWKSTDGGEHWTDITSTLGLEPPEPHRQDRHRRLRREPEPRVGAGGARARGRRLSLRRRRQDVGAHERQPRPASAGLLLHAHLRGPEGRERRLRAEHRHLQVHRRRQDLPDPAPPAPRRQPRPVDRAQRPQRMINANDGGANVHGERRRDLDRPGLPHGAVLPGHHHEARALPHLRRPAGQLHGVPAVGRMELPVRQRQLLLRRGRR